MLNELVRLAAIGSRSCHAGAKWCFFVVVDPRDAPRARERIDQRFGRGGGEDPFDRTKIRQGEFAGDRFSAQDRERVRFRRPIAAAGLRVTPAPPERDP
ncbi:MAG TPA: hypothetical protein VLZ06_11655, partial [Solirubrobacteraceae bacterium]|nr:hypothetical protein [Solirubrobacteraceae bacterium]